MPIDKIGAAVGIFQYKKSKFKRRRTGNEAPKPVKMDSDSDSDDGDDDSQDIAVVTEKKGRGRRRKNDPQAAVREATQRLQEVKKMLNKSDDTDDDDIELVDGGSPSSKAVKPRGKAVQPPPTEDDPDGLAPYLDPMPLNRGESDISRKISQLRSKLRSVGSSFEKNSLLQEDELVDDTDEAAAPTLSGEIDRLKIVVGFKLGDNMRKYKIYADEMMEKYLITYVRTYVNTDITNPSWCRTVRLEELVFTIARTRLEARSVNTPLRLGMENGDIIEVERREDVERRKEEERNALLFEDENKEATSAADGEDGTRCTLVVDYGGNERKAFKIRKTDPLEKLFKAVAKHKSKDVSDFKFMFDGLVVHPNETVETLDLEDDDLIEAGLK